MNNGIRPKLVRFKEKNNKRIIFIFVSLFFLFLLGGIYLYSSFAVFSEEKHFNVINGTLQDPGDIYFAYYVDGEITRSMPKQNTGYTLNVEKSNCTNGVIPKWDNASWTFQANYSNYNATDYTRTRCNLYFEKTSKVVSTALGNIEVNMYTPDFSKSACDDEACESHEKGIFETTDDDGTSYYYRGSVENNYVKFAGYYWRIIRINGNGSIRMIYDGTSPHDNGESSTDRMYGTSEYNSPWNDNMYVGYMYTNGNAHGTGTSTTIKNSNDSFYKTKLLSYASYIDNNVGFCGDRSTLNNQTGVGTGTVSTYYKGYLRVSTSTPSLKCENSSDYYTITGASNGNKALTYPIGLITVDDALLAGYSGGVFDGYYDFQKRAYDSYLTMGERFWTMTPVGYYNAFNRDYWSSAVFIVYTVGDFDDHATENTYGLRPVINLKSTLKFTGDGTKNSPYIPNL